jgi:hypothetical protein
VAGAFGGNGAFAAAQGVLLGFSLVGLVLGVLIPGRQGLRTRA